MNMPVLEQNLQSPRTGKAGPTNVMRLRSWSGQQKLTSASGFLYLIAGMFAVSSALAQLQAPGANPPAVPPAGQTPVPTPVPTPISTPGQPKPPASAKPSTVSPFTAPTAATSTAPSVARPSEVGPTWKELTAAQQASLKPLAANWSGIGEAQKRKWLAVSKNYPALPAPEQAKLHSRMTEWASLSQQQRTQARLNFAETKKLSPGDQSANWQAYQALSPEDRQKLAAKAAPKPAGAAVAVRPVPAQKLAAVPATRSDTQHATSGAPGGALGGAPGSALGGAPGGALGIQGNSAVDRNTLLPRPAFADDPTVRKN